MPSLFARLDANYRTDIFGGLTPTLSIVYTGKRALGARPLAVHLPLGEGGWVQAVERAGTLRRPRGSTAVEAGDVLDVLSPASDTPTLRRFFADEPVRPPASPG